MRWMLVGLFCLCRLIHAQNVISSLNGLLVDPSGAGVPGATCTRRSPETGTVLNSTSEAAGLFTFPTVAAGTYRLEVKAAGFQSFTLMGIVMIASERHALGSLTLQVGDMRQSIEVTAEMAALQLASGEGSGLVRGPHVNDLRSEAHTSE